MAGVFSSLMNIILLGPPGAGKGTISEKLVNEFGFAHISPGEIFREEVRKNTELGRKIKEYIERGNLVPDTFTDEVVKLEVKGKKNILLDGYPRVVSQAKTLETFCKVDKVIYLHLTETEAVKRFSGRRVCPNNHVFHLQTIPPKQKGVCDVDGLPLSQRADDKPEIVKQRFRVYQEKTAPVAEYYQKKGLLQQVDASGSPEKVYLLVRKVLKS